MFEPSISTGEVATGRPAARTKSPPVWDRIAFGALGTAIVWAPWPLGSNRPWAVALLATLVWAGLLAGRVGDVLQVLGGRASPSPRRSRALGVPVIALIGFALLQVAQLVPGWGPQGGTISIDPFHTRHYLLTTAIYLGAWFLVLQTVRTEERLVRLLAAIVAAGVLQAAAAVLLYSTGWRYELWFAPFEQGSRATATFPSPDNLAGYLELTLSAALGWMLSQFGSQDGPRGRGWRARTVSVLAFAMSGKMLLRLMMVVMVVALVMTHSRMGNGAFFIALSAVSGLVALLSRALRRPALWLFVSMAVIDVVIIGQWVGLDRVVQRLQDTATATAGASGFGVADVPQQREESIQDRMLTPRLSLDLALQRPWFGHGGGTYVTAFPPFKRDGLPIQTMYWDHAHDDYVQVACDMGFVGLALWLTIGLSTSWRAVRSLGASAGRYQRGAGAGCLMALACMGLHSVVDFNLHIPAIAMTLTVLLAAVWALPPRSESRRRRSSSESREGDGR